jgi:integrase
VPKPIKHANLETPKARTRLKRGRQEHVQALAPNGIHFCYQRHEGKVGRWFIRRHKGRGKYLVTNLGTADDKQEANGTTILNYAQAQAKARAIIDMPDGANKVHRMTVRQAFTRYVEHKKDLGQSVADVMSRGTAHILPPLGDWVIADLSSERLQRWLANMAEAPAQARPKAGKPQYRPEPEGEEAIRKRRNTANRVLTMLKAILNFAFDAKHVSNRDAWGRRLKPFKGVEAARVRYLTIAEARRLVNACDKDFRPLVRAALETGARYGELTTRLEVSDFNPDSGTLHIRKSKTGTARHIQLTEEGAAFFKSHTAGRSGGALMFSHGDGSPWKTAQQSRPMREAVARANITPSISIHGLRHTWASHAIMNGVPLMVVAKNLGHANTRMVETIYGHLAPSFIVNAIRENAPKYHIAIDRKVKVFPKRKNSFS